MVMRFKQALKEIIVPLAASWYLITWQAYEGVLDTDVNGCVDAARSELASGIYIIAKIYNKRYEQVIDEANKLLEEQNLEVIDKAQIIEFMLTGK